MFTGIVEELGSVRSLQDHRIEIACEVVPDDSGEPVGHPQASLIFESFHEGQYTLRPRISH